MKQYKQLNILELWETYSEDKLNSILLRFYSPKNQDVEDFIRYKSLDFAKQRLAISYLVFSDSPNPLLLGYFTLANKFVSINESMLSKTMQKKILKFAQYDYETKRYVMPIPLIA